MPPQILFATGLDDEGNSVRPPCLAIAAETQRRRAYSSTVRLGDVDELERLVGDIDGHRLAGGVGDELAQHCEVAVEAEPPRLSDGSLGAGSFAGHGGGRSDVRAR